MQRDDRLGAHKRVVVLEAADQVGQRRLADEAVQPVVVTPLGTLLSLVHRPATALGLDAVLGGQVFGEEPVQQLVGMLAAVVIYEIYQSYQDWVPPSLTCPRCGEDDIDHLVWLDDEKVRCTICGTVYDPNQPDPET